MSRAVSPSKEPGLPPLSLDEKDPKASSKLAIDPLDHLAVLFADAGTRKRPRSATFRKDGEPTQVQKLTTSAVLTALAKELKKP